MYILIVLRQSFVGSTKKKKETLAVLIFCKQCFCLMYSINQCPSRKVSLCIGFSYCHKCHQIQLQKSSIKTNYTENLDLSWALKNIKPLINQHIEGNYILIFPFSSEKHKDKIWPYFVFDKKCCLW